MIRYRGRNRDDVCVTGRTDKPASEFVEAKFRARWRELTVTRGGVEVGAIVRHPDTRRRSWWAEK